MKTHEEILEQVYKKIPELRETKIIGLPIMYFRKLDDIEFEILYRMPGLVLRVSPACMKYIDDRRKQLKLPEPIVQVENENLQKN